MKQLLIFVAVLAFGGIARADVPIVYSRCPRSHQPFDVTGPVVKGGVTTMQTVTLHTGDLQEMFPDTARQFGGFVAPCDLVYRDASGNEKVLYDCISTSTPESACAALDAAVSFDAKTVAFSVFRGTMSHWRGAGNGKLFDPAAENTGTFAVDLPGYALDGTEAQLFLVDIATGTLTALPHTAGDFDSGPAFLSDGRLAFTSTRMHQFRTMPLCNNTNPVAPQTFVMDLDGRNAELASPHAFAAELHPIQLTDGRVALSSWQIFGMQAMRHPNGTGTCGTTPNFFHLYAQNPDGSGQFALYGQHVSDPTSDEYPHMGTHVAAHFLGQTTDGRLWTAEYYRANNLGMGSILGFPLPPPGQEGPNPEQAMATNSTPFRPYDMVRLAPWGTTSDGAAPMMPAPELRLPSYNDPIAFAGKLGHPAGLPDNRLLVTWAPGQCTINTGAYELNAMRSFEQMYGDNPWCDAGIYMTPMLPPTTHNFLSHPSQLTLVVNSPDYHELMARPVVPYQDIFGVEKPAVLPRAEVAAAGDPSLEGGTPFGVLGASSIIHRETHSALAGGFRFNDPNQWGVQGTDAVDYTDDELCGVRILATYPNREKEFFRKSISPVGDRVAILGEFPVRKFDGSGKPILDALGMPDTSFRVRFPANTAYLMQGIDCQGRTLNTDQTWQSLRPGEKKTCNGCHVHSDATNRLPFETTIAGKADAPTVELGMGKVPLLTGGSGKDVTTREVDGYSYMIEFERDVMPIFASRCVSCHGAARSEAGLRLDLVRPADFNRASGATDDSTWARLAADGNQSFVADGFKQPTTSGTALGMPNLSKYVRMLNARGSLLYWKAANKRTDGRTDAQHPSAAMNGTVPADFDIDFGADHPTDITEEELGIIGRWIDTGAGWGSELTTDTVRPALHVVADADGQSITQLRIGTADVGDGIDPSSLSVCVVAKGASECGQTLSAIAAVAGVVAVPVSPALSDVDAEVWVRVKDRAGNESQARFTVGHLLSLPPAPPSTGDESGCGCRVPAQRPGPTVLLGLGVLALLRRRRRA